jgi:HEAT repeat protein
VEKGRVEQELKKLRALRDDVYAAGAAQQLARALASKRSLIVAAAADIVADHELDGHAAALTAAFDELIRDPVKRDPGCRGKTAAVRALLRTGAPATTLFVRGIGYVQREPAWGGAVDTAAELRGTCAMGLVCCNYPDAMVEVAELLADPEPLARVAAAQALAHSGQRDVVLPLLRFKARSGDPDARVLGACYRALLLLAPEGSLELVASFARSANAEHREVAMLALGESRIHAAVPILCELSEHALGTEEIRIALLALGLARLDAAWDYLLAQVRSASVERARLSIEVLATYRADPVLCDRTLAAANERHDPNLLAYAQSALAD